MATFEIPYGKAAVQLKLPDSMAAVELRGRHMAPLPDVAAEIRRQIEAPVGTRPLRDLAAGLRSATIVVGDPTHYNGYELWLPGVLAELNSHGIPDKGITLYLASGTQGALSQAQKEQVFGTEILRRVQVLDHDCDAEHRMEKVGRTTLGTVLKIDGRVLNSDLLLVIGGVQYHYFSGYTGGPKAIMPGCASRDSILHNSKYAIDAATGDSHPKVGPGIIVGNPVNRDMHDCCSVVKPDMCINVVVNEHRQVAALQAGDYAMALRFCAKFLDDHNRMLVPPAGIAVIGGGGFPKDKTLFQAYKSLRHAVGALEARAAVIWLAECVDGEGEGMMLHRAMSRDELRAQLEKAPEPVTFCALMLRQLAERYEVHFVSAIDPEAARGWGFVPHTDINRALGAAMMTHNANTSHCLVGSDLSTLLPERVSLEE